MKLAAISSMSMLRTNFSVVLRDLFVCSFSSASSCSMNFSYLDTVPVVVQTEFLFASSQFAPPFTPPAPSAVTIRISSAVN